MIRARSSRIWRSASRWAVTVWPTSKRGYGFHPLTAFVDHGPAGTGEPLAILLRPGNAGSNTATDHITVVKAALAQLPGHRPGQRHGRKVLIRTDGAGGTKQLIEWLTSQRLSYSVGFTLPVNTPGPARQDPRECLDVGLR